MNAKLEPKEAMRSFADDLRMFSSQVYEAINGTGDFPSPWNLDDIVRDYADLRSRMTPNKD